MAMQPSRTPHGAITGINVTPLVDITLVLLIIFMVTAKLIVGHQAMPLDLPKAASGNELQEIFSVVLFANGAAQVNGQMLSKDDDLLALASTQARQHKDLRAVIKADGAVFHSRVMHTLDLLRRAGISKIAFGVVPPLATERAEGQAK
ncbi:MAG TPA: biopolymer transporter ExbD [Polyangiales bacterium]